KFVDSACMRANFIRLPCFWADFPVLRSFKAFRRPIQGESMSHTQRYIIAGVLTCVLFTSLGLSQSSFGSITGTVKDQTGSLVPAAEVEVTNDGTGATRRVTTSSAGVFNVPNLDLGSYKVRVSGKGFTTYERGGLNLAANQII